MINVIKKGFEDDATYQIRCGVCGSTLEFSFSDVTLGYIYCPICGNSISMYRDSCTKVEKK